MSLGAPGLDSETWESTYLHGRSTSAWPHQLRLDNVSIVAQKTGPRFGRMDMKRGKVSPYPDDCAPSESTHYAHLFAPPWSKSTVRQPALLYGCRVPTSLSKSSIDARRSGRKPPHMPLRRLEAALSVYRFLENSWSVQNATCHRSDHTRRSRSAVMAG